MKNEMCTACFNKKSTLECGICHMQICKSCAQFLSHDQFSFLIETPDILCHQVYCNGCYDSQIVPEIESYDRTMQQAREILIFNKDQGKETRFIKRLEKPIQITNCNDHNEALLRLAFIAAKANYNSIVDVDLKSKKIKNNSYQTTVWSGSGIPTNIQADKLMKDRALWQNPN